MTDKRSSVGSVRRGAPAAVALSVSFLMMLVLVPLFIAAVVTLLAAVTVGAVRTRAVTGVPPHSVTEHSFPTVAVVSAPRAAQSTGASSGDGNTAAA